MTTITKAEAKHAATFLEAYHLVELYRAQLILNPDLKDDPANDEAIFGANETLFHVTDEDIAEFQRIVETYRHESYASLLEQQEIDDLVFEHGYDVNSEEGPLCVSLEDYCSEL